MNIKTLILVLLITLFSCKNSSDKKEDIKLTKEKEEFDTIEDSEQLDNFTWTSLKDTLEIEGNSIVILRPDSLRIDSYLKSGKDWIYEVDSDFGFGVTKAVDSFHNPNIGKFFTDKRFLKINNCNECPILIDRDSINYGIILTSSKKNILINENIAGAEYYTKIFTEYFKN